MTNELAWPIDLQQAISDALGDAYAMDDPHDKAAAVGAVCGAVLAWHRAQIEGGGVSTLFDFMTADDIALWKDIADEPYA